MWAGARLEDVTLHDPNAAADRRRIDVAHGDIHRRDGSLTGDRITYHCRGCGYTWDRHRCARGHVLMKHGRLTLHRRVHPDDPDSNVVCSACGHAM